MKQCVTDKLHAISIMRHEVIDITKENTQSNSPYMEFLAKPRIVDVSPIQKASLTLSCTSTMPSSHSTLLQSVSPFWKPSIRPLHPLWYSLPLPLACSLSLITQIKGAKC